MRFEEFGSAFFSASFTTIHSEPCDAGSYRTICYGTLQNHFVRILVSEMIAFGTLCYDRTDSMLQELHLCNAHKLAFNLLSLYAWVSNL